MIYDNMRGWFIQNQVVLTKNDTLEHGGRRTQDGVASLGDEALCKDGSGSTTHGIQFGYHFLPHFKSDSDTNTNMIGYEYRTDGLNSNLKSDIYSTWLKVYIAN